MGEGSGLVVGGGTYAPGYRAFLDETPSWEKDMDQA